MSRLIFVLIVSFSCLESACGQVVINELCPSNADLDVDPDFFNFSAWIELHNTSSSTQNIGGFFLTDDPADRKKWMIPFGTTVPGNGYRVIWCDGMNTKLHTNFSLDSDGEDVVFSNSSGTEIDRILFPEQHTNISYGRLTDGGGEWGYLISPTSGRANRGESGAVQLSNPHFSLKSGRYPSSQTLVISHPMSSVEIRYSIDGSEPSVNSLLYRDPIFLQKTTTVKAKAFKTNFIPSKSEVKSFFINEHTFSLPVVSLSTNPRYLWDNSIGIYAAGTNGIEGNCAYSNVNWNQDWDRHAVLEYFDKSGEKLFDQSVDVRIGGGCSRTNPQKSLVIKARDKYGDNILPYQFFDTKEISKFGGFFLRNSGNDFSYTMFRDALMHSLLVGQMDVDYLAYQPAIVYINGNYWGIQNIREKIDADYIESNYAVRKDDLDLIETWGIALEGTNNAYMTYLDSLQKIDRNAADAYKFIERYIDVQEYINYLTAEIYYVNTDWPGNNVKFWRQRSTNGKFRWILWDTDFGFGLYGGAEYAYHPTLNFATAVDGPDWPNPPWSTLHLRLLLEIPRFREKFVSTMLTAIGTTFSPDRVIRTIDNFQNRLKAEMPYHIDRWDQPDTWDAEVQRLRDFAVQRNDFMRNYVRDFFSLSDEVRITMEVYPANSGAVNINGITVSNLDANIPSLKGLSLAVKAEPLQGYTFSHFLISTRNVSPISMIVGGEQWRYFDSGTLPSESWAQEEYNDEAWISGNAQFGYGENDETTVLNYGPDDQNKFTTTYFRKTFTVADTSNVRELVAKILCDDGAVVYLNGAEALRVNMPDGDINYGTWALSATQLENTFVSYLLPHSLLKPGLNTIAVEVHQNSGTSSDLSFDLALSGYVLGSESTSPVYENTYQHLVEGNVHIQAYYEPANSQSGLVVNEICASNSTFPDEFGETDDWIELYNAGEEPIDIRGFFVSDDIGRKTKFSIRGNEAETIIAPGEYKLLWADEDVPQGPLHVNFKLSSDGEEFGIYQKVGNTLEKIEEVVFPSQSGLVSYSRIPDVTGPFQVTGKITPRAANEFEIPTSSETEEVDEMLFYPNPASTVIHISSAKMIRQVRIFNATGSLRHAEFIEDFVAEVDVEYLARGFYTIAVISSGGTVFKKIILR